MSRIAGGIVAAVLTTIIITALYFNCNFQNGHIQGNSMAPTLQDGDRIVSQRWGKEITHGAIVEIKLPNSQYPHVKRVIGMPGQLVLPPLSDTEVELGPDEYWVMGDNRPVSKDSRHFGPVNRKQIKGIIIYIRKMR